MSNLNQYHPFRESIQTKAVDGGANSAAQENSQTDNNKNSEDREYTPWFSFKTKLRFLIGLFAIIALWMVISSLFKENPELDAGFYATYNKTVNASKKSAKKEKENLSLFDEHDLDERGRTVESTKSKVGFFENLFCRGGKRAFFCN